MEKQDAGPINGFQVIVFHLMPKHRLPPGWYEITLNIFSEQWRQDKMADTFHVLLLNKIYNGCYSHMNCEYHEVARNLSNPMLIIDLSASGKLKEILVSTIDYIA